MKVELKSSKLEFVSVEFYPMHSFVYLIAANRNTGYKLWRNLMDSNEIPQHHNKMTQHDR